MSNENEVSRKIALHIGPASMHGQEPYLKVDYDILGNVQSSEEVVELADNINDPLTSVLARQSMGCATCKAASHVESGPENELRINAKVDNMSELKIQAPCSVLVYAANHGFPQDASCMQAKKPIHLVVSATNQKFSFFRTLLNLLR